MVELLFLAKSQALIAPKDVRDSNGKTLLHLACQKNFLEWFNIMQNLIQEHNCKLSAVDKVGNTIFHESYQCGNRQALLWLLNIVIQYSLSCNPDAFNNDGITVLRMALQKNDIEVVKALLITGRVDPRRGSPDGLPYEELLITDDLLPQDVDGSALQMVAICSKCIPTNIIHSNYTLFYLSALLNTIFKDQHQISIADITRIVQFKNVPLPEKPNQIHRLLIGLSDHFEIRGELPNDYGNMKVSRKGELTSTDQFFIAIVEFFAVPHQNVQQPKERSHGREPVGNPNEESFTPDYHSDGITG